MAKSIFLLAAIAFVAAIIGVTRDNIPAETPALVASDAPSEDALALIRGRLLLTFKRQPDAIHPSPATGFYEVVYGPELFYVSADGRHLFSGELIDLESMDNLTERRRAVGRLKVLEAIPESSMIVYRAADEQHVLTVFTDIDCVYCRKLHSEVPQLIAQGITVRYLAYPRAGLDSPSFDKAVSVWCAADRNGALDRAKAGMPIQPVKCDSPVEAHMKLAAQLGVNSTPTLILEDGRLQPGYVPAGEMLSLFE